MRKYINGKWQDVKYSVITSGLTGYINKKEITPTTIAGYIKVSCGDFKAEKAFVSLNDGEKLPVDISDGNIKNDFFATGLRPDCSFNVTVYAERGSVSISKIQEFKTTLLEMETLQPKGVSSTSSIVAAKTNLNDKERNVGFQWKKYDAPESLKPSEAYAAIYDGMIEGHLNKLQSLSYYNVCAFYKSADGNYYYSNWVTFDPSDFSYFEPTVHTYPSENVQSRSVVLRGYVLT